MKTPMTARGAELLRNEYVIAVTGHVRLRDADTINKNIPTGEVELVAEDLRILNEAKHPPFLPSDTALANEETGQFETKAPDGDDAKVKPSHDGAVVLDFLKKHGLFPS